MDILQQAAIGVTSLAEIHPLDHAEVEMNSLMHLPVVHAICSRLHTLRGHQWILTMGG